MKPLLILAAAAAAFITANPSALAQQPGGSTGSSAGSGKEFEEVIITGTRRTDRTVTDSASPVDIITSAELRAQPAANMLDQVKNVVPSFFVGQNTISDASSLVRALAARPSGGRSPGDAQRQALESLGAGPGL